MCVRVGRNSCETLLKKAFLVRSISARIAVCFFFFQAEDGIRDLYVTGVQTCALPISSPTAHAPSRRQNREHVSAPRTDPDPIASPRPAAKLAPKRAMWFNRGVSQDTLRSEERRVGKEGRDRVGGDQ